MKIVLLDNNFISKFTKECPEFFNDKQIFISIGSFIELVHKGFTNQHLEIEKFIQKSNVFLLKDIFPFEEEKRNYPLKINLKDNILPKFSTIKELFESELFKISINFIKEKRKQFGEENIVRIKDAIKNKKLDYNEPDEYRHFIKSSLPSKIGKQKVRLRNLPFNVIVRVFVLEKFKKNDYKESDFNDLLICFLAPYFDYVFLENRNHDILHRIKDLGFKDIFLPNNNILCSRSSFVRNLWKNKCNIYL